jgi:hypothetical protein
MSDNETKSTFTITCFNCGKYITKPYLDDIDLIYKLDDLFLPEGWFKKQLSPEVSVWYCSDACAAFSAEAQQWRRKYERTFKYGTYIFWALILSQIIFLIWISVALFK